MARLLSSPRSIVCWESRSTEQTHRPPGLESRMCSRPSASLLGPFILIRRQNGFVDESESLGGGPPFGDRLTSSMYTAVEVSLVQRSQRSLSIQWLTNPLIADRPLTARPFDQITDQSGTSVVCLPGCQLPIRVRLLGSYVAGIMHTDVRELRWYAIVSIFAAFYGRRVPPIFERLYQHGYRSSSQRDPVIEHNNGSSQDGESNREWTIGHTVRKDELNEKHCRSISSCNWSETSLLLL